MKSADAMICNDTPKCARVGCADRLAFIQHRRAAVEQRAVDDVRVPDHPPDVRRAQYTSPGSTSDVLHRPLETSLAAVVPHDSFG